MAIYHLKVKPVQRSDGRSAVAAAAYRAAEKLLDERTGDFRNYKAKQGVLHTEIMLPTGIKADWAMDRNRLWNSAEKADNRKNSRTAREILVALPHELNEQQRLELTREFARQLVDRYGVAADVAVHDQHEGNLNFHAHILLTTRKVQEDGLGEKSNFEKSDSWLREHGLPIAKDQVQQIREDWEGVANEHLAKAGLDIRIDHRSFEERGIEGIMPTHKVGMAATHMKRKGLKVFREKLSVEDQEFNKHRILQDPNEVLKIITSEKSVFTYRDIARAIHRYVADSEFQKVFAGVMSSSELIELQPEENSDQGKQPALLTSKEMVNTEILLANSAERLSGKEHHASRCGVAKAMIGKSRSNSLAAKLNNEQKQAVRHITGSSKIAAVIGHAGSGKSTMLAAARVAWESQGFRVCGAALAGKAADGLQQSSGIESRTLASLERSWKLGQRLKRNDVLVVDEAGMVDSRQLARIAVEVEKRDAKLVLVGDPQQLQPIGPGAAFRAIVKKIGYAEMNEVRRQKKKWQQKATSDFAIHNTKKALVAYDQHGNVEFVHTRMDAFLSIGKDFREDCKRSGARLALAYTRKDVKQLNNVIRAGLLIDGRIENQGKDILTSNGKKTFAAGDRIVLLKNDRKMNVKNGSFATIKHITHNAMNIVLDDEGRQVEIDLKKYKDFDYGYAATIHKSQGATVDRTFVLASKRMDANLTYVAMSRHKENAKLYADRNEFKNMIELSQQLSLSKSKQTTLDVMDAAEFKERRMLDPHFNLPSFPKIPSENEKSKQNPVQSDAAIDDFANTVERGLWLEKLGAGPELLPVQEIKSACEALNKIHTGLAGLLIEIAEDKPEQFKKTIMELAGEERVEFLKKMANQQIDELKAEAKSRENLEPAPAPSL